MNKASYMLLIMFLLIITGLTSSFNWEPAEESAYTAVLMTRAELEKSVAFQVPRPIQQIGKIYKKDNWIFITEKNKGIHLIDNSNPVKTGFIRIPGCLDMAVKNSMLYADNSVDLITVNLSNLPEINVISRVRNVFPEMLPPDLVYIPSKYSTGNRPKNTVIIEWKKIR